MKNNRKNKWGILIVTGFAVILVIYWNWGGQVKQFKDGEGNVIKNSIATKEFVEINGVKLGMFIRGKDRTNPVLLFLHGGPGMPEYFLKQDYPIPLEEHFTVVWLEQRGAGLSYNSDISPQTITTKQFVADDVEVIEYLCNKFNKDKIYLMAHSWGTKIGIEVAKACPERLYAYIPMAQIVNQEESEKIAYHYMIDYFNEVGDHKIATQLQQVDFKSKAYEKMRDNMMHKAGIGTARNMQSVVTGVFLPSLRCKEYTLIERLNIWRGKIFSYHAWQENNDEGKLIEEMTSVEVPIFFLHGKYDYTVNVDLTKAYYEILSAPVKRFYEFDGSAHSPLFEEPQKAMSILQEIVRLTGGE